VGLRLSNKNLKNWLTPEKLPLPERVLILPLEAQVPQEGLVARCYGDGQLQFLGFYRRGRCDEGWVLTLDHGIEKGVARREKGSGGSADFEIYQNGHCEMFDAWSDYTQPRPIDYQLWVRGWIKRII
jgi:hypothetical protein